MMDMRKRPASSAVAEAIREARIKKRMSQSQLARRSGLSVTVVNEIESKARPVTIPELQRLEYGLGKDGTRFFSKAFMRCAKRDPKLRAMTIEVLDVVISDLEKAIRECDEEMKASSTSTVQ